MDYVSEFKQIYSLIKRDGAAELLKYLESSDYFVCPASTRFHSNHKGGLVEHSVKVYKRFLNLIKSEYGDNYSSKISDESIAIMGLLHDVCKVNTYREDSRNVKVNGVWNSVPYYTVDDQLPYGHGEKSVYIISGFMKLTREEAMGINWHMGFADNRVMGGSYSLSPAYYTYPTAMLLHLADMQATYLDESIDDIK